MYIKRLKYDFKLLDDKLIAHKGIYGYYKKLKKYVLPNSLEACKIAIDNNISFECDIRNTLDNVAVLAHENVIFHEGKNIKVSKNTYSNLKSILGNDCPPTLEEVLEYNNGKVGVIVDAKEAHIFYSSYRENLSILLNKYAVKGEVLLQSFNPFFMLSLRKHLYGVVTGQLICRGKTILDSFRTPKTLAYAYERIISLICFISRTDIINMENHSDIKWHKRTRYFISKYTNVKISKKKEKLLKRLDSSIYKGRKRLNKIADGIQLKLVKISNELTKKPVMAFTIENPRDFNKMENLYIVNYIVDFSKLGVEKYIETIIKLSK